MQNQVNGENIAFQQMVEQLDIYRQKKKIKWDEIKIYLNLTSFIKYNSKWISFFEKKINSENIHGLGLRVKFLDLTPKAWSIKGKNNKLDFIKIKNVCSKENPV